MAARFWIGGGTDTTWVASPTTNWAATSGGTTRVAAPTSADDVTFDGVGVNGNTVSVISATANALSFTVTSGYTSTITWNGTLVVAGNITLGANMTIAGASSITSSAAGTLTSNGKTWPNSVAATTGAGTRTFADAWTIGGTLTSNITTTFALNGLLTVAAIVISNGASVPVTFAGAFGFITNTLNLGGVLVAINHTFANGVTYTVNTGITINQAASATKPTITSDHATNKAIFNIKQGATCSCNCNFTRIDASGGRAINTFNGTVTTCLNINSFNDIYPAARGGVATSAPSY